MSSELQDIDSDLLEIVRLGKAVLFLGAGASKGATNASGEEIPDGEQLAEEIASTFLGHEYRGYDFKTACDLAASHRSVREVQEFIHSRLVTFGPASHHLLIPKFVWSGIITTNYDQVIERAYSPSAHPIQELVTSRSDADKATSLIQPKSVLYVKLHGCISQYQIVDPPLVATTEQLIDFREGRNEQFKQFLEWARNRVLIFAGYKLTDPNLRSLLGEIIKEGDKRPRHYIVRPGIKPIEIKYWSDRRFSTISMTFAQFLQSLDDQIPSHTRSLALLVQPEGVSKIRQFISVPNYVVSDRLETYLGAYAEVINQDTYDTKGDAKKFYSGFIQDWFPIDHNLDVLRKDAVALLEEQIIPTATLSSARFYLLKGHAGSGKSVALRRIAWEAGRRYGKLCVYIGKSGKIDIDCLEELFRATSVPLFLFIDNAADFASEIERLMLEAKSRNWPLVLIAAERQHEWNVRCPELERHLNKEYTLSYLNFKEIDDLLIRLMEFDCLGYLANMAIDDQRYQLREVHGRQLLVALHEATKGRPFRDIISDEYQSIVPDVARLLYLDICALNRFGAPVRAGLIARVHGISFDDFQKHFFHPLESVVITRHDAKSGDYVYESRHRYIASLVFETALPKIEERFELVLRLVGKLNPAYSYDQFVLTEMLRARNIFEYFKDVQRASAIFEAALASIGKNAYLFHQWGIYEMMASSDRTGLDKAEANLRKAEELEPNNRSIRHSLAELDLTRSRKATDRLEREVWRQKAKIVASSLARSDSSSYPHHTLAKISNDKLKDSLDDCEHVNDELSQQAFNEAIKDAEESIRRGLQAFPNDSYLLAEQATFHEILSRVDRALVALVKSFESNPRSEVVARRLARIYMAKEEWSKAQDVLRVALDYNVGNLSLNYMMAQAIRSKKPEAEIIEGESVLYYLARSFQPTDKNYEARFWYARQLCLLDRWDEAKGIFASTKYLALRLTQKREPRSVVVGEDGNPKEYRGQVTALRETYGFVRLDHPRIDAYFDVPTQQKEDEKISVNDRLIFHLAFNLFGPIAQNIRKDI